jgi:hypothetical protein
MISRPTKELSCFRLTTGTIATRSFRAERNSRSLLRGALTNALCPLSARSTGIEFWFDLLEFEHKNSDLAKITKKENRKGGLEP